MTYRIRDHQSGTEVFPLRICCLSKKSIICLQVKFVKAKLQSSKVDIWAADDQLLSIDSHFVGAKAVVFAHEKNFTDLNYLRLTTLIVLLTQHGGALALCIG